MVDELTSMADVLDRAEGELKQGRSAAPRTWPTGFDPLDTYLGGGVRAGELILLGGPQGLGKTTFTMQVLREVLASGGCGVLFSYEHDEQTLLERFIAVEAGALAGEDSVSLRMVRAAFEDTSSTEPLMSRLGDVPGGADAVHALRSYGDRLHLHRSNGSTTDVEALRKHVRGVVKQHGEPPLVVVDYLQKVAVQEGHTDEEERVTRVVEGLKDLALDLELPVVAIVAADKEGLVAGRRLRVHNLRGSSALAYEADVVLILNDKFDVVARHHLVYDTANAERFRDWCVLSIEKNRSGIDRVDLEFRKRFAQGRFENAGRLVPEQLVDERVFVE